MQIRVQNNDLKVDFQLNESPAAKTLIEQLPLTLDIDNFGGNEKIFYPNKN